ncbi:MAG: hypothetical protein WBW33_34745, partial [Bryobacteraceae bacterium]
MKLINHTLRNFAGAPLKAAPLAIMLIGAFAAPVARASIGGPCSVTISGSSATQTSVVGVPGQTVSVQFSISISSASMKWPASGRIYETFTQTGGNFALQNLQAGFNGIAEGSGQYINLASSPESAYVGGLPPYGTATGETATVTLRVSDYWGHGCWAAFTVTVMAPSNPPCSEKVT